MNHLYTLGPWLSAHRCFYLRSSLNNESDGHGPNCADRTNTTWGRQGWGLPFAKHQLPNLHSHWAIQIKVSSELSSEEFICAANSARPTIKHLPRGPECRGWGRVIEMIPCSSSATPLLSLDFWEPARRSCRLDGSFKKCRAEIRTSPPSATFYFCLEERNTLLE